MQADTIEKMNLVPKKLPKTFSSPNTNCHYMYGCNNHRVVTLPMCYPQSVEVRLTCDTGFSVLRLSVLKFRTELKFKGL